jgi:NAD(P)H-dependent FMN reductase
VLPVPQGARDDARVGGRYFVGSQSSTSINRVLSRALVRLAPEELNFTEIPIGALPLYSPDFGDDYPPAARALKEAISQADAVLFVSPEYNRSIPGALKNAIDWASRPWGQNPFHHIPAGDRSSIGPIGTAVGQQSLRAVLSFCDAQSCPVRDNGRDQTVNALGNRVSKSRIATHAGVTEMRAIGCPLSRAVQACPCSSPK